MRKALHCNVDKLVKAICSKNSCWKNLMAIEFFQNYDWRNQMALEFLKHSVCFNFSDWNFVREAVGSGILVKIVVTKKQLLLFIYTNNQILT